MEPVSFTLKKKVIPLDLDGEAYELRELSGTQRDTFLSSMSAKVVIGSDGKPTGIKSYKGLCSELLSMCVYDSAGKLVPEKIIQEWPTGTQTELLKMAQSLSGLVDEKKELDDAKKD